MALPFLLRSSSRPDIYICVKCTWKLIANPQRRWLGMKYLAKVADAEKAWQDQALRIRQKKEKSMLTILEERGLVQDITGHRDEVDEMMTSRRLGAYVGIDPTAASLHIGHLLPLMSLFWMYVHGYHAVTLVGGATSKIGDPTGRLSSREDIHRHLRAQYVINIHYQLKKLWINVEAYALKYGYRWEWAWKRGLVNNNAWMNKLPIMEVLQILGPGVRLGDMLAKDTVKSKKKNDEWMSFAEFTYPILQAWDWWHMYNTMGIRMQIGGSDQYGNIAAGVHAVKYIAEHHPAPDTPKKTTDSPFGLTAPLLTTSAGAKFGKSAGNAIWLDNALTSTFDFYSHFLRTSDADVGDYLKRFTFMPIEQIDTLVEEHMKSPSERKAQHKLAIELVELVHGKHEALDLMKQRSLIFKSPIQPYFGDESSAQSAAGETTLDVSGASALDLAQVNVNNRPRAQMKLPRSLVETKSIGKVLFAAGLAESKSEGHRLAQNQAVYIGGAPTKHKQAMNEAAVSFAPVKAWKPEDIKTYLIHDKLLMLRRGKHNIRIIEVVEDEEYEKSGLTYPGKDTDDITKKMLESQQKKGKDLSGKLVDAKDLYAKEFENNVMVEWKASADEKDEDKEVEVVEWQRPEERITQLMYDLKRELEVRKSKLDEKNAPKPKFTGHSRPSNRASHHRSRGSARLREEGPYLEKKWIGGRHQLEWREHGE